MITVEQLLERRPDAAVFTVETTTTVFEAMKLMAEKHVGALLVVDSGRVAGILTERDYARKVVLERRTSQTTLARDIMSAPVVHVGPEKTSEDCIRLMGEHRIRHLPVMIGSRLVGMISMRDLIDEIIADRTVLVDEIEAAVLEK